MANLDISLRNILRDAFLTPGTRISGVRDEYGNPASVDRGEPESANFLGRLVQSARRFLNIGDVRQRNRDGISAYLNILRRADDDLADAAVRELQSRHDAGKPLTLRRVRLVGQGVLLGVANRKADAILRAVRGDQTALRADGSLSVGDDQLSGVTDDQVEALESAKSALEAALAHIPEHQQALYGQILSQAREIDALLNRLEDIR